METWDQQTLLPKIYKYCAYQERCRSEIESKLAEWGVAQDHWPAVLEHLAAERFWDEARFAYEFARGKFNQKQWGRQKIRHELRRRQVPEALIEQALEEAIAEPDYQQALQQLIAKKARKLTSLEQPQERAKLIRFLQQRGYSLGEILAALG